MGHAMRSGEIISWLQSQKHEVHAYAGGAGSAYLRSLSHVTPIPHLHFIIREGKVRGIRTLFSNLIHLPWYFWSFSLRLYEGLVHRPDVIITDYEPLTAWTAFFLRIPLLSIDNQHSITDVDSSRIPFSFGKITYQFFTRCMVPFPQKTLIFSFISLQTTTPRATLIAPVVKKSIQRTRTCTKTHFLVYLSGSNESLIPLFQSFSPFSFIVYGLGRSEQRGNVTLKKFDEHSFVNDLASCKGFITNGGMTSLSEALFLRKPILCVPLAGQSEQQANASFLIQTGNGIMGDNLTSALLTRFCSFVKRFRPSTNTQVMPSWKPILQKTLRKLTS
jgi:uncharacterized protein (TIGR00661 family)